MILSLRSRINAALQRPVRKYAGHRTLEDVIASVETLLRQRGAADESAILNADLDALLDQLLQFHLDSHGHVAAGVGYTGDVTISGTTLTFTSGILTAVA